MPIIKPDQAIGLLKKGEAVAFPTETVYGLGADAWNPSAIHKVFEIKGRPADNPLIVHIPDIPALKNFAEQVPDAATKLVREFWPGPLTIILRKKPQVLDLITGGLETVAVRWPKHPLAQDLISGAGPLVAPSANRSGRPSPTRPEHVFEDFGPGFPVVDGGDTDIGLESTVIDLTTRPLAIYRPGRISLEELERAAGEQVVYESYTENGAKKSPGTRYSHYSPDATVRWLDERDIHFGENALYLYHGSSPEPGSNRISYSGDYLRMAAELYDRFRQADREGYNQILVEQFDSQTMDSHPVVRALENRISKAARP